MVSFRGYDRDYFADEDGSAEDGSDEDGSDITAEDD